MAPPAGVDVGADTAANDASEWRRERAQLLATIAQQTEAAAQLTRRFQLLQRALVDQQQLLERYQRALQDSGLLLPPVSKASDTTVSKTAAENEGRETTEQLPPPPPTTARQVTQESEESAGRGSSVAARKRRRQSAGAVEAKTTAVSPAHVTSRDVSAGEDQRDAALSQESEGYCVKESEILVRAPAKLLKTRDDSSAPVAADVTAHTGRSSAMHSLEDPTEKKKVAVTTAVPATAAATSHKKPANSRDAAQMEATMAAVGSFASDSAGATVELANQREKMPSRLAAKDGSWISRRADFHRTAAAAGAATHQKQLSSQDRSDREQYEEQELHEQVKLHQKQGQQSSPPLHQSKRDADAKSARPSATLDGTSDLPPVVGNAAQAPAITADARRRSSSNKSASARASSTWAEEKLRMQEAGIVTKRRIPGSLNARLPPSLQTTGLSAPAPSNESKSGGGFQYVEVVRNREARAALPGHDCAECRKYYEALDGLISDADMELAKSKCSRHRARFEPYNTPDDFWRLSFPDSESQPMSP